MVWLLETGVWPTTCSLNWCLRLEIKRANRIDTAYRPHHARYRFNPRTASPLLQNLVHPTACATRRRAGPRWPLSTAGPAGLAGAASPRSPAAV